MSQRERASEPTSNLSCVRDTTDTPRTRGAGLVRVHKVGVSFREDWTVGRLRVASAVVGHDRILVSPAAA